jgi:glycosyltransferase involved in cell wall biosynthesis
VDVVVLIPVLGRPHRVAPLLESLTAAGGPTRPLFLISPDDDAQAAAIAAAGAERLVVSWPPGRGDYAPKMNAGFAATDEPFVFLAADDLRFRPGWAEAALATAAQTGAGVVGTNDLGNGRVIAGDHATHPLVRRDYGRRGTLDDPGKLLHEGYWHNFVDDEFIETAKQRGQYAPCPAAVVEHLHPAWGKAPVDETYLRGTEHFLDDAQHYAVRAERFGFPEWRPANG